MANRRIESDRSPLGFRIRGAVTYSLASVFMSCTKRNNLYVYLFCTLINKSTIISQITTLPACFDTIVSSSRSL